MARTLDPGRPTHGVRVLGRGSVREFLEDVWVYNFAVPAGTPPAMPWITGEHVGHRVAATFVRRTPGTPVRLAMTPDDTVLETGGDMTRVVVTAVDSFGQVVPRTNHIVSISVSGAGDFFGESPIALEDGKTAFFVKTRAGKTGAITCRACCKKMTEANTRINVREAFRRGGQNRFPGDIVD